MNNFYLKYKYPVAAILALIVLGGIFSMSVMKTSLFPDITFPKIKVIAENGDQPVEKMMVTVTVPLENAIKRAEDLSWIRNTTSRGSCEISAFLNWGADVDLGKQQIEAQINAIKGDLPPDVKITIEKMNPSILAVMGFSLEGKGQSPVELRQLAEFTVKPILSRIEGISEVAVVGGKVKEYHVTLDPMVLSELHLTPAAIADVLSQSNFISSIGHTIDYHRLYLALTDAAIDGKNELENTIVVNSAKRMVRLKDVAKIEIGELREYIRINANGRDVPLIAIFKQPKANLLEVTRAVQSQMKEMETVLPAGVVLRPFYNQADFVQDVIHSLRDVLWIGLLLAIVVTILYLRSLKACSAILITLPITLGLTMVLLRTLGYTFNIMTIGAIAAAIGLIIDDAIVVVEQIHRTHEEHPQEHSDHLVAKAIHFLLPAMIGSSLSTIVIFLPFILMGGVAGAYFKVMTDTMIIALTCSFLVTWIGLPVVYLLLSRREPMVRKISKSMKQRGWVYFFIQRPAWAGAFALLLILLCLLILPRLPSGFLPDMDEGTLVLDYKSPPGSSLEATDGMLKRVDRILQETPEVESFSRRTGTQLGFFITEANDGDFLIQLRKDRRKTTEEVADDIRSRIETALPGLQIDFGQLIGDMLGDLMATAQPIEVKLFGDDHERLAAIARRVATLVEQVAGTADVYDGILIAGPIAKFEPRVASLEQYQLTPADLQFQLQTKLDGTVVGGILEKNQMVNIRLFDGKPNPTLQQLQRSSIFLQDGQLKPLNEFTDLVIMPGVSQIDRENLKPMVAITARLNNRDLGSTLRELQKKIGASITLPAGYQIVYGGAYAEQQQAFRELLIILIAAVLLVFSIILFLYRNIKVSLAIIFIAVLGISGSLAALFLTGTPLNVGSYTGLIMIVGIIGENSIFTYLQYLEGRKNNRTVDEALVYSISSRLRPKLMTALGAIAALFPLALGIGTGAQMHQPLAIAIIGGMLIALPLLLVVLPTLLRLIEK